ncbi:MAG: peptide deformylase [Candidatus Krumholzibacteria bacterium]|nr:peptide deformylase [Candidatus Krumholzibacteria bacterium]
MGSLRIKIYGDEILRGKSAEVEDFDEELGELVKNMVETMIVEEGVGLAAPQVGVSRRIAVVNPDPYNPDTLLTLVNPRILSSSDETDYVEEGCLSVPGVRGKVERPILIEIEYQDAGGKMHCIKADGLVARIIQHEIDHLDGILAMMRALDEHSFVTRSERWRVKDS